MTAILDTDKPGSIDDGADRPGESDGAQSATRLDQFYGRPELPSFDDNSAFESAPTSGKALAADEDAERESAVSDLADAQPQDISAAFWEAAGVRLAGEAAETSEEESREARAEEERADEDARLDDGDFEATRFNDGGVDDLNAFSDAELTETVEESAATAEEARSGDLGVLDLPDVPEPVQPQERSLFSRGGFLSEPVSNVIPFQFDDQYATPFAQQQPQSTGVAPEAGEGIGALADAVQNALRNIYGSDATIENADPYDPNARLNLPSPAAPEPFAAFAPDLSDPPQWRSAVDQFFDSNPASTPDQLDENTTEAVLSYLYNQDAPTPPSEAPSAHPLGDLREAVERSRRDVSQDAWSDRFGEDDAETPPPLRGAGAPPPPPEAPYYRGGALRSPSARPSSARPANLSEYAGGEAGPSPSYSPDRPAVQPHYAMVAVTPPQPQDQDSSRMLGAAGIGLIGGIALAGVLSVFLFNSVISTTDAPVRDFASPSAEPAAPAPTADPVKITARIESAAPAPTPAVPQPIAAADVSGPAARPVSLNIAVDDSYSAQNVLVSIRGVPEQARLSAGIDVGAGSWLLPPQRLAGLQIVAPEAAAGSYTLETQIMEADARTPISDPARFTVAITAAKDDISDAAVRTALSALEAGPGRARGAPAPAMVAASSVSPALTVVPPTAPDAAKPVVTRPFDQQRSQQLVRDGNRLMREGDIMAARKLYEEASAMGDPEASLAMGRSYDPSYFEQLPVKTGKPDPAQAFDWYMRALDGGVETAKVKIDSLKQWLLR
ncbi:MAG: hypothetical protein NW215_06195 [Hyphomicrobiales bacterium]|nr:hypothetical protein [Hyphomicrobiales bacterium]